MRVPLAAPGLRDWGHLALAGLLMHGVYLGGVFVAIRLGLEAGLSALIVSLQPLLVAAAAPFLLAERIGPRRWLGLGARHARRRPWSCPASSAWRRCLAVVACVAALGGHHGRHALSEAPLRRPRPAHRQPDPVRGRGRRLLAGRARVRDPSDRLDPRARLRPVLAHLRALAGAIPLLYLLLRRGAASQVSSLFFLVPPTTAMIAWPLFGERLGPVEILGMVLALAGVALVNREGR